jgi:small subunit ribosomal protein S9
MIDFAKFKASPARIVPASPSYFSGSPRFIDNVLMLESLQAKYAALPTVGAGEAPRMAWFKLAQFRDFVGEPVPMKKYKSLLKILQRLNRIQPEMVPEEVHSQLAKFLRPGNPYAQQNVPRTVDENGRARAKGKRKESTAVVQLVEGEGEIMVNGKSLVEMFQRVHDRESALWALRSTQRMDKYNAWITVKGGGVTGQAEAITLAIARALLIHEPALKPALRKGEFPPMLLFRNILMSSCSWCHYCRCPSRGEEEARSRQGPQDAHLGQALRREFCRALFFYQSCIILPSMAGRHACSISCTQCIWGFHSMNCVSTVIFIYRNLAPLSAVIGWIDY